MPSAAEGEVPDLVVLAVAIGCGLIESANCYL